MDKISMDTVGCKDVNLYTVDALLLKLAISSQVDIWKRINSIIQVKGKVTSNKSYGKFSYIALQGIDSSITIKCPTDISPNVNENIVFEGMAVLKPSKFNSGLDLLVEGTPVAQLAPIENLDKHIPIEKKSFLRLSQFIESSDLNTLTVIGSKTGITDVISQIDGTYHANIKTQTVVISNKDAILEAFKRLSGLCAAIAIVRGGDDDSLSIWDDRSFIKSLVNYNIPFYVALGHTHRVLQVSHYADESFSTPSAFGNAINSFVSKYSELLCDKKTADKLIMKQSQEIAVLKSKEKEKVIYRPYKEWVVIALLLLTLFMRYL